MPLNLLLDSERNAEVRAALDHRKEQLKKLRKNLEDAGCNTTDVARRLDVIDTLQADTDEQTDIERELKRTGQAEFPFEGPGEPQSIEDSLRGAELEAAGRIRLRRLNAALLEIAPTVGRGEPIDDETLRALIALEWGTIEHTDPEALENKDRRWPMIHAHSYNDGDGAGVIWCGVHVVLREDLTALAFYFDVLPELFAPAQLRATMETDAIVVRYRELLGLATPEQAAADPLVVLDAEVAASVRECLLGVLPDVWNPIGDLALEENICYRFAELGEGEATGDEHELPVGFIRQTTPGGNEVINFLRDGIIPAFHYGVNPATYTDNTKDPDAVFSLRGAALVQVARALLNLQQPETDTDPGDENPAANTDGKAPEHGANIGDHAGNGAAQEPPAKPRRKKKSAVADFEASVQVGAAALNQAAGGDPNRLMSMMLSGEAVAVVRDATAALD